ncbi:Gfo/Idh/MocA family protein [Gynuella sunshinyii]|uniref:Putative dehydrogenase-related protein n=1 Tax=Gynuella sunshinyii YC6258 TaxID=1445510 RepID=A0A0C5VSA6_9GAMM|nr:Gfo/Idh/MocA family oxidoreductase [Gynuella sunshinyii]AJQ93154.1 putative dehydrogenase-related protein [Gynuella sunshinyii YC6258]
MNSVLNAGVIGCGNISNSYLQLAPLFKGFRFTACADLNMDLAQQTASRYELQAMSTDALLADDDIDIVVNLTIPSAHADISLQALQAGKHVYTEKPLCLNLAEGRKMQALAQTNGLRVGSAPDTFLGGAHQLARKLIDDGTVGNIVSGSCHVMGRGMEMWHPNPEFFFKAGGGPVLDMGPYYIANLIQLLGPVRNVTARSSTPFPERTITSQPHYGDVIQVETPTTLHAILEFEQGALITLSASWDVQAHGHAPMELYGSKGSLYLPDPNFFGGKVTVTEGKRELYLTTPWEHPFGVANQIHGDRALANYRTAGLAEMVLSIHHEQDHMCSLDRALHGVEVLLGIMKSGETGTTVKMTTTCERPRALNPESAALLLNR